MPPANIVIKTGRTQGSDAGVFYIESAETLPMKTKRKAPFAANNASRKKLEQEGWTVGKVDQSVNTGKFVFTRDLWEFGDLLATSPSRGNLIVQATADKSTSNFHARVRKVRSNPIAAIWLAHPSNRIQVHSWEGSGSNRECRVFEITANELAP